MFLDVFRKGRHLDGDGRAVYPPMPWDYTRYLPDGASRRSISTRTRFRRSGAVSPHRRSRLKPSRCSDGWTKRTCYGRPGPA